MQANCLIPTLDRACDRIRDSAFTELAKTFVRGVDLTKGDGLTAAQFS